MPPETITETIWETPLPYLIGSALVGGIAALSLVAFSRSLKILVVVPLLAAGILIGLVEAAVDESLSAENRLALLAIACAGAPVGSAVALASAWYVRWIRGTFRRAEERLRTRATV